MTEQEEAASRDRRMGVVEDTRRAPRTRHIAWASTRFGPLPICLQPASHLRWRASTSKAVHELPVCRRCIDLVEKTKAALDADNGFTRPSGSKGES